MRLRNNKAFTIIEVLIAAFIIMIVTIGFLRGVLFFIQYSIANKMKDKASEYNLMVAKFYQTIDYSKIDYFPPQWQNATCDTTNEPCPFLKIDSDNDGIPDFYDPYVGKNDDHYTDPTNIAGWLTVKPNKDGTCLSQINNLYNHPNCIISIKDNLNIQKFRIYTAITTARIMNVQLESGIAIGVITWYFDPNTNKYKFVHTIVFKEKTQ
ncbi:prepilin-type N-terminal cleavage/methylation domain-containing protein [Sulfurihydrogenibium sp.]|jgi:type II secretory pathway pseudopilin PulG|uniref:type IV pilus modification PilV family protein n=1 Tax=Sulfurihydrogenibium sp. TaxID=2053621 RepID=UPI002604186B|nr:prepilin-type N-terminal cleavage/methylation domain-containing protein [Sulfurihydrogenibium sp.]